MTSTPQISYPAGYVTSTAVGFADASGGLTPVGAAAPLPVAQTRAVAPAPLQGQASGAAVAGPFVPLRDAPVHLQLSGSWTGTVTVQRSTDGGTTRQALTAGGQPWARFTANANEIVWQEGEDGASLFLDVALATGTVTYRVSQ